MQLLRIIKSHNPDKKFDAVFKDPKTGREHTTSFGDSSMQDYTQHHDKIRRTAYRSRHQRDLLTNDPTRAGYLSYWILWGDSTSVQKNITDYRRRFNM